MKRSLLVLSLALAVLLGFYACQESASRPKTIAILAVNDMHSAIDVMPQFAALADSLRTVYPELLVFSAGDNRTGNPINDQYRPANHPMIALMNQVGFDLSALGNHEWDGGIDALRENIEEARFPFICANVFIPEQLALDVAPYVILENQGVKIAVLGLLETRQSGIPGAHPKYFKEISFKKGIDVIPDYLFLKDQSEAFLLLSHLGFEGDREVAERFPQFDAIIGGHSHTLVEPPVKHHGVLITQAGSSLNYATLTLITVNDGKVAEVTAQIFDLQHRKKADKEIQAMVDGFNGDNRFDEVLAVALTDFKNREELGCMVCDGVRAGSGADFAFNNTGGIRRDYLKKGPITVKDVYNIDPFGNDVVVYTMTGKQLERFIMETYKKNGRQPSFVSGMSYQVNTDRDGYPKSVTFKLDHGQYSKDAKYKVAMNSYMVSTLRFESVDEGESQFMTSEEMVIQYLCEQKTVSYRGVHRVE